MDIHDKVDQELLDDCRRCPQVVQIHFRENISKIMKAMLGDLSVSAGGRAGQDWVDILMSDTDITDLLAKDKSDIIRSITRRLTSIADGLDHEAPGVEILDRDDEIIEI